MQNANQRTPEQAHKLRVKKVESKFMIRRAVGLVESLLQVDTDVKIYWEWPHRCTGWPEADRLSTVLREQGQSVYDCKISGCRYEMVSSTGGLLGKLWRVRTSDRTFFNVFGNKVCLGGHHHERIEGTETAATSYYPIRLTNAIAQFWKRQNGDRGAREGQLLALQMPVPDEELDALMAKRKTSPDDDREPTEDEKKNHHVLLQRLHRAAAHPNNNALARMVADAGKPAWQVQAARDFHCDVCAELKRGGEMVPAASTVALPGAWEAHGMDVGELADSYAGIKTKFLLCVDLGMKLIVVKELMRYNMNEQQNESAAAVIRAWCDAWLQDKPCPATLVADTAKSFSSKEFGEFLHDRMIGFNATPGQAPWSH